MTAFTAVSIVDKGDTPFKKGKGKSVDETEMMLQNTETTRTSPARPSTKAYCDNESIEVPSLDEIFSRSNDGLETIDVQPTQPYAMNGSFSQSKETGMGSEEEWSNELSKFKDPNTSRMNPLAIETSQSQSKESVTSNTSSNKSRSANNLNVALQTISEHKSDKSSSFVSPSRNFDIASPNSVLQQSQLAGSFLRMTSEGKFLFNNNIDNDDESSKASSFHSTSFDMNGSDMTAGKEPTLRRRALTGQSNRTNKSEAEQTTSSNQWEQVKNILRKDDIDNADGKNTKPEIETGVWNTSVPTLKETTLTIKKGFMDYLRAIGRWTRFKSRNNLLTQKIAKDSTYAVVTFSSRQAAVAARHCIADGRGVHRWLSLETVPVVSILSILNELFLSIEC